MTPEDEIRELAIKYARKEKKRITTEYIKDFKKVENPVSIFMAGSPGAGKTEFTKSLVKLLKEEGIDNVLRIDPDDLRAYFIGYQGINSYLFQGSISILTDAIHDKVIDKKINFILDGTFASYTKSRLNVERSLRNKRQVRVFFILQDPQIAWNFTKIREEKEGRRITKEQFVHGFINSKKNVVKLKKEFGNEITAFCVYKNYEDNSIKEIIEINDVDKFESSLDEWYNEANLDKILV